MVMLQHEASYLLLVTLTIVPTTKEVKEELILICLVKNRVLKDVGVVRVHLSALQSA